MTGDPFFGTSFAVKSGYGDRICAGYFHLDPERPVIVPENRIGSAVMRMLVVHTQHYGIAATR
jgi:hypothetical protein